MSETDKMFAGSIPQNYDRYLVPLIFESFAQDIAQRVAALSPRTILETAAGSGVVTAILPGQDPATPVHRCGDRGDEQETVLAGSDVVGDPHHLDGQRDQPARPVAVADQPHRRDRRQPEPGRGDCQPHRRLVR